MARDKLKLEFPTLKRKEEALDFIHEFEDEDVHPCGTNKLYTITETYGGDVLKCYENWLEYCFNCSNGTRSANGIPTDTYFLVRKNDNRIVGMFTIRYRLNNRYWNNGGNISCCIRRSERLKGYAKTGLYLAISKCHEHELEAVLIDCDHYNLGSSRAIRALGGILIREYWSDIYEAYNQAYVIDVESSTEKYYTKYKRKIWWW